MLFNIPFLNEIAQETYKLQEKRFLDVTVYSLLKKSAI